MTDSVECLRQMVQSQDKLALANYLNCCDESKTFSQQSDAIGNLASHINEYMNDRSRRVYGLIILDKLLYQLPKNTIGSNLAFWMDQCIKGISQLDDEFVPTLSITLLRKFISSINEFPDLKKNIKLNIIPKLVESFFKRGSLKEGNRLEKLKCLEVLLKRHAKSCVKWKDDIHNFAFEHLESTDSEVHYAGLCFLHLALSGPSSADNVKYTESWEEEVNLLISALHSRLDLLFENINEIRGPYNEPQKDLKGIPPIEENSLFTTMQRLTTQFKSLAEFLFILCRAKIPCETPFKVDDILSVVYRGLAVNGQTLKANISADSVNLLTQIPLVHQACIRISEALILSLQFEIFRHNVIPKVLLQTLQWTQSHDWPVGHQKPHKNLRISAYKCLNLWMTTTRSTTSKSEIPQFLEDIINNIISDISYKRETVALNIEIGKSKKRSRKIKVSTNAKVKSPFIENPSANSQICLAALELIQPLMEATKYDIKEENVTKLLEVLIGLLSSITSTAKGDKVFPIPYSVEECRLELYRSLLVLTLYNKPHFPSPVCYTNKLFEEGYHDTSVEVSKLCSFGLLCVNNILYPCAPLEGFVQHADKLENFLLRTREGKKRTSSVSFLETTQDSSFLDITDATVGEDEDNLESDIEVLRVKKLTNSKDSSNNAENHSNENLTDNSPNDEIILLDNSKDSRDEINPKEFIVDDSLANDDVEIIKVINTKSKSSTSKRTRPKDVDIIEVVNLSDEPDGVPEKESKGHGAKRVRFQVPERTDLTENPSTSDNQTGLEDLESEMLASFVDIV